MPATTPRRHIPYPLGAETPNVPRDMRTMALTLDNVVDLELGDLKPSLKGADHSGWLVCDGRRTLLRAAYPAAFVAMMDAFVVAGRLPGAIDADHFSIPDFRGRTLVGLGTHADVNALLKDEGFAAANVGKRRPKHKSSVNDPGHHHSTHYNFGLGGAIAGLPFYEENGHQFDTNINTTDNGTGISIGPQTGNEPTDQPAFAVVNVFVFSGAGVIGDAYGGGLGAPHVEVADYQLSSADAQSVVEMLAAGALNVTIPTNATDPIPIGALTEIARMGAGAVNVVPAVGVTLRSPGGLTHISHQYGSVNVRKRDTNEWVMVGDLV